MADTADRRSEGRGLPSTETLRRRKLSEAGLCSKCGVTEVVGRKTCYACTDKQQNYQMAYYVRLAHRLGIIEDILSSEVA